MPRPPAGRRPPLDGAGAVPHMGWNDVEPAGGDPLAAALPAVCYFAHSFAPSRRAATCRHHRVDGGPFASAVAGGRVAGAQFHPERSGPAGARSCALLHWAGDAA